LLKQKLPEMLLALFEKLPEMLPALPEKLPAPTCHPKSLRFHETTNWSLNVSVSFVKAAFARRFRSGRNRRTVSGRLSVLQIICPGVALLPFLHSSFAVWARVHILTTIILIFNYFEFE
jgi:hypothetical protein